MIIHLTNKTKESLKENDFERIAEIAFSYLKRKAKKIELIITSDKEVRSLNKAYRNIDKTTDVLSFIYHDQNFPGTKDILGEIIISLQQVERQSREQKENVKNELYKIFIHGLVHLMGYDHSTDEEHVEMKKIEEEIYKRLE